MIITPGKEVEYDLFRTLIGRTQVEKSLDVETAVAYAQSCANALKQAGIVKEKPSDFDETAIEETAAECRLRWETPLVYTGRLKMDLLAQLARFTPVDALANNPKPLVVRSPICPDFTLLEEEFVLFGVRWGCAEIEGPCLICEHDEDRL